MLRFKLRLNFSNAIFLVDKSCSDMLSPLMIQNLSSSSIFSVSGSKAEQSRLAIFSLSWGWGTGKDLCGSLFGSVEQTLINIIIIKEIKV